MFIDVCLPENNEAEFIKMAKMLSMDGLCFLYMKSAGKKQIADGIRIYTAAFADGPYFNAPVDLFFADRMMPFPKGKKIVYYFNPDMLRRTFHKPAAEITQVVMKEIKESGRCICISYWDALKNSPEAIEKISFIWRLASKYRVKTIACGFAASPFQLRSRQHIDSIMAVVGAGEPGRKKALGQLAELLREESF